MPFLRVIFFFITVFALSLPAGSFASPTPAPGGANQVNGISGKLGDTVFNGVVRVKVVELRDAAAGDHPETILPSDTQRVMLINVIVRNGLHREFGEILSYTLADKDDVTFLIPDHWLTPNPLAIQQAGSARQTGLFPVAKDFQPVKLIVQCPTCSAATKFKAIRIQLPPATTATP